MSTTAAVRGGERSAPAERGVLTLGFGAPRYRRMAVDLARSLRLNSPGTPLAVVTDHPAEMSRWFDVVVPHDPSHGRGFAQKLALDRYTPFRRTLFVDADCLAVRDVEFMWELFAAVPFGVCGRMAGSGRWFGADIAEVRAAVGLEGPLPLFNGGLMYWSDAPEAGGVFRTARELVPRYSELGFGRMSGRDSAVTDEPLVSIAMALHGLSVVEDGASTMRTPIGSTGPLRVDVLRRRSGFTKEGVPVSPAIVHFCGDYAEGFVYRREVAKLRLPLRSPLARTAASTVVDVVANPVAAGLRAARGVRRLARAGR